MFQGRHSPAAYLVAFSGMRPYNIRINTFILSRQSQGGPMNTLAGWHTGSPSEAEQAAALSNAEKNGFYGAIYASYADDKIAGCPARQILLLRMFCAEDSPTYFSQARKIMPRDCASI